MKGGVNLRDLQQKKKEAEIDAWVSPKPCVVCGKSMPGPYGRDSEDNWTCNSDCERSYRATLSRRNHEPPQGG